MKNQDGTAEIVETKPKEEISELDKLLQAGNISAVNEYIAAEAAKQGVDPHAAPVAKPVVRTKTAKPAPVEESEEDVTYQMTVELAPGHSIVVSDSTEDGCRAKADLAQKVAQAATNALRPAPIVEKPKPAMTADEATAIGTKMMSGKGAEAINEYLEKNPDVLAGVFKEKFGIDLAEVKDTMAENRTTKQTNVTATAVDAFKEAHPEYHPSEKNKYLMGNKMIELAQARGQTLDTVSLENLEEAYTQLTDLDWLDAGDITQKAEPEIREVPVVKKKATSSAPIGNRGGADTRQLKVLAAAALTREQFEKMTPTQMAQWYNDQVSQQTGTKPPM